MSISFIQKCAVFIPGILPRWKKIANNSGNLGLYGAIRGTQWTRNTVVGSTLMTLAGLKIAHITQKDRNAQIAAYAIALSGLGISAIATKQLNYFSLLMIHGVKNNYGMTLLFKKI